MRRAALWKIAREVQRQGWCAGWQKIHKGLAGAVPIRLVQELLGALKRRRRAALARRRERERVHVEVFHRDALWSQDATHLGRCPAEAVSGGAEPTEGHVCPSGPGVPRTDLAVRGVRRSAARRARVAVLGEVLRDVASTRTIELSVGPPATGEEVVAMLERACAQRGGPPLVYSTDNGSQYTCKRVARWLAEHRVVHLRSVPHTPEHNAWVERGHRELKEDAELGKGVALASPRQAEQALARARERIDRHRLRATRGYLTPAACDARNDPWYCAVGRERFYESVCRAVTQAVDGIQGSRARRRVEREAIFATLERFGLVRRTRGWGKAVAVKPEGIS